MGDAVFSVVNIIMMTSSISTLDSTFSSTAKLIGPDIAGYFSGGKPLPLFQATTFHMHIGENDLLGTEEQGEVLVVGLQ
jgi:hypothetical protein